MIANVLEASEELLVYAENRLTEVEVRERMSCHDARSIPAYLARKLPPAVMALTAQVCVPAAVDKLNALSANEYWGLTLIVDTLLHAETVPLTAEDINGAAQRLLAEKMKDGTTAALLRKVNENFGDLSADELADAKAQGIVVTDESFPFEMEQDRINPIFCL
jgi:hypothetical protein